MTSEETGDDGRGTGFAGGPPEGQELKEKAGGYDSIEDIPKISRLSLSPSLLGSKLIEVKLLRRNRRDISLYLHSSSRAGGEQWVSRGTIGLDGK